ncbi:TauD/TfdA dioxygenase family protein [Aquimarina hainanensis]|uniref:TauD/TfdA dioxygenase family protein n=1 Tax=Aquimarina hainanensis TaxID=1578017 RepID=A0ABW5NBF2_9FLAO|nr:TauD/TfdA family dioxygenase [Aquimarina sp. TRL1]QKX06730.1 TauD/TfdA family dioxygenase [Aquimarina sp. TRL1]
MDLKPLAIGSAVYTDLNLTDDSLIDKLKDALYKNRIIVIKNQELSEEDFCNLAYKLGEPIPYIQENYNHPDHELIFVSSNVKQGKTQKIGVPRTGGYWHSDTAFEPDPKAITMLMPKILPVSIPRTTRFIDMSQVYNKLPKHLLDEIENAEFMHSGRYRYKVRPDDVGLDVTEILEMIDYIQEPVAHPAVLTHPYTGEKTIYGTRGFTIGIKDRGMDDSARILQEIFDFAETEEFIKEVRWEKGDVIIWDNRFLAHSSGRKKAPTENIHQEVTKEEETMMYRITLKDGYPLSEEHSKIKEEETQAV